MKKHLEYFKYVLLHKLFVFQAGLELGVSLWQLIIHDWQKFTPIEWTPYVLSFYGPWKYKERPEWLIAAFDRAWLHHQHYGPHHWQYWILVQDSAPEKYLEIPEKYLWEMLADWIGAGKAITGKDNLLEWYTTNQRKIRLHKESRRRVELAILARFYPFSCVELEAMYDTHGFDILNGGARFAIEEGYGDLGQAVREYEVRQKAQAANNMAQALKVTDEAHHKRP